MCDKINPSPGLDQLLFSWQFRTFHVFKQSVTSKTTFWKGFKDTMSLSDLASLAIVAQGIFFIVSIYLVWYQLRENTKLVRAANTQKLVELSSPFNLRLAQDRELTWLWQQGVEGIDNLDSIDRERYFSLLTWWLVLHENIYHQWTKKMIDEDTYISWTRDLEYFVKRQNIGTHWERLGTYFETSFAEHVATIIARQSQQKV